MNFDYYHAYSLTTEEVEKMYEWQKKHNKKFHKKGFGYQGASPVSNFEVRFGSCSIGTWADCVCLDCLKNTEAQKGTLDEKKFKKAMNNCTYEIRGLE